MIAKFEGHYHGGVDEFLVSHAPSKAETDGGFRPVSGSRGTPAHVLENTLVLPFNDLAETEARIRGHADRLACVIMEPVERSYIAPDPEFLRGVREVTARNDIPLIFDEVMSGFRVAFGGAQHAYGVTPDLTCLGKVIGGGLPCGAFLGRSDILELADPRSGEFFHSGTFAGYPPAMAAGMATLDELEAPGGFEGLLEKTQNLAAEFERIVEQRHVRARVPRVGTVFSLLERGIFVKPAKPFYLSTAHDDAAIRQTIEALDDALQVA
ncbi:MAG: aminotransferase class III-fold pyridoxal phosphate-dependent enzyme [Methanobacteriota archaeon]|nr:MAG: aminotransferase class III-fold pyridoxal phosphate-dependent enzyme [Euryarchaeota archaeon]